MKFDFKRIGKKIIVGVLSTMLIVGVTAHESNALTKYIQLYAKTGTSLKTKESYLQAYTGQIYKANSSENDTIYQREIKPYNKKPVVSYYKVAKSGYYAKIGSFTGYVKVTKNKYRKATLYWVAPIKRLPNKVNGKYIYVIDKTTDKGIINNKYFKNVPYIVEEKQMEKCNSSAYIIGEGAYSKKWSPKAKNALSFVKKNTITNAKMSYW